MTRSSTPRSSSSLFDPPSLDDLEYLPDPLGRLGFGSYEEKPDANDPQDWENARADWRNGASMAGLFGDRSFDLQANVGAGQPNRRADVFRLQSLLHREGYLDAAATDGPTGYWGGRDDAALRRFQMDNGLGVDGWAGPDGETIEALRGFYRPQRPAGRQYAQAASATDDPVPSAGLPIADAAPASQGWVLDAAGLEHLHAVAVGNEALKDAGKKGGKYIYPDSVKQAGQQECVVLVQKMLPGINQTKTWRPGASIRAAGDPPLQPGTAIATFRDGKYTNKSGYHAAIFLGYGKDKWGRDGIVVYDQWRGQPAQRRVIAFNPGAASASNNAGAFSVIQRPGR
jgi:hypothetical protein